VTTPPLDQEALRIASLVGYFREHRDRYTPDALTSAVAAAGYSPAEIEAAWSQVGWGSAERAVSRPSEFGVAAVVAILFVTGTYVGALGLGLNRTSSGLALPGFVMALFGGALAWVALRESNPALARGIGCGIVIAVGLPVVLFLVVLGVCVVAGAPLPI